MKVVFVVLHYCQINVTIDCIMSLLKLKGAYQIVIVDNASPDGSGKMLEEKYRNNGIVHVVLNSENKGFASGNNVGYAYAKEKLGAKVIIIINNDTLIKDVSFIERLLASSVLNKYHIVAPDIITLNETHQNPFAIKALSYKECLCNIRKIQLLQLIYSIPVLGDVKAKLKFSPVSNSKESENIQEMILPHGAAIIYTPLWVNQEQFAFYPGTFMYLEEEILYYYILKHNYRTIYLPELKIIHLEDVSTNTRFKKKRKKALFQIKQLKKSYRVLLSYIKENKMYSIPLVSKEIQNSHP